MLFDVRTYGATGDGCTTDHAAFQRAIDHCAEGGGGMVVVPPGRYRCGSIQLRSNIRLHLEAGAEIHGSENPDDYEIICPTSSGIHARSYMAMIHADEEDDISISGSGSIHGGGTAPLPGPEYLLQRFRPSVFLFRGCHGLRVADVQIKDSRYWTIHLLRSRDVRIRGISISNHRHRLASVGIVADSSQDVLVSDCIIEAGDDGIAIKSTCAEPCENVTVVNCIIRSSQAAFKIGAQSIGTISNIMFSNSIITGSHVGIGVYMKDGGLFSDISFCNLSIAADNEFPITIDATSRSDAARNLPGQIRDLRISGISMHARGRCYVQGHRQSPIEHLLIRDVSWSVDALCDNVRARKNRGSEHTDPEPGGTDRTAEPYQFIFAHVRGLRMADVACHQRATLLRPDRGLLYLEDVHDAAFADLRGVPPPSGMPATLVRDCSDLHGVTPSLANGSAVISGVDSSQHPAVRKQLAS